MSSNAEEEQRCWTLFLMSVSRHNLAGGDACFASKKDIDSLHTATVWRFYQKMQSLPLCVGFGTSRVEPSRTWVFEPRFAQLLLEVKLFEPRLNTGSELGCNVELNLS